MVWGSVQEIRGLGFSNCFHLPPSIAAACEARSKMVEGYKCRSSWGANRNVSGRPMPGSRFGIEQGSGYKGIEQHNCFCGLAVLVHLITVWGCSLRHLTLKTVLGLQLVLHFTVWGHSLLRAGAIAGAISL